MKLRVILTTSLLFSLSGFSNSNDDYYTELFQKANVAYKSGAYDSARTMYSEISNNGFQNPELFYNLGNTYFKNTNIPAAILYYERASRMNPSDPDIQYNLGVANSFITDKIEPIEPFFIFSWADKSAKSLTPDGLGNVFLIMLLISCTLFTLFFTSTNKSLRQFGFILGILFVFTSMVTFWLGMHASALADRKEAIVFSPSVNVKSEPSLNATIQFVIHEGLKVEVTGADGDWTRINLADGNSGWISSQSIELI
jgi:tetratricopeptide (TPR) repeat protein